MKKLITIACASTLLIGTLPLTGCGGGDSDSNTNNTSYNGNTSPAAIDITNVEVIGKTSGESVQKAGAAGALPAGITVDSSINLDKVNDIIISTTDILNLPAGIIIPDICNGGGSVETSNNLPDQSGEYTSTSTFTNCIIADELIEPPVSMTLNGTAVTYFKNINSETSPFSITYENFKVTDNINGGTTTLNMIFACSDLSDTFTCTYSSDFTGYDGIRHRISEFSITGDKTIGFEGTAIFYHGTFGTVSITASGITYGNCGVLPDGGSILFESTDGSSGTIDFSADCSVSGTWTDSNSNSGSWPEQPPT